MNFKRLGDLKLAQSHTTFVSMLHFSLKTIEGNFRLDSLSPSPIFKAEKDAVWF